jgi:integrase
MAGLTDTKARSIKPGDVLPDGTVDGLTLVGGTTAGRGRWLLRYTSPTARKRREMGLGSYPAVTIAAARKAATAARERVLYGADPIDERREGKAASAPKQGVPTVEDISRVVVEHAVAASRSAKAREQLEWILGPAYIGAIAKRPVDQVRAVDVAELLRPLWREKPETGKKLLTALRRIFDHARVVLRDRHEIIIENPARWDDLRAMGFVHPAGHTRNHPSLPYSQMPQFIEALRNRMGVAAIALEFVILTNVRTSTARLATFSQFDLDKAVWNAPVQALKDKNHRKEAFRIPLSPRAVEIVRQMQSVRISDFVFPGREPGKPLNDVAMLNLLERMQADENRWRDEDGRYAVVHGFRASFRTWAEEAVAFPHNIIEEAMGHKIGSKDERAYRRTDLLEQRREIMDAWANHCEPAVAGGNVVKLRLRRRELAK